MAQQINMFANFLYSTLMKKITVPSEYHDQIRAVKTMQSDDLSGLVDSLTDFSITSASVDFTIDTDNEEFTKILTNWLGRINIGYKGKVPIGINELAKEYLKERWKYSSFPVLKISKWESIEGILLPTKMFFVDSECIYAEEKDEKDENLTLFSYDYYLGDNKKNLLDKNVIFSRPYGRWFDKYSIPYLIKRGVYHNWRIIQSLKDMQSKILDQIIPYMLLIKKGTAQLANQQVKTYSNPELQEIIGDFQKLIDNMKSSNVGDSSIKSSIRATNFDEEIKHLIPDLKTIMDVELFAQAERNVLAGLGFIDIVEAVSTSRRESVLNPKAFIKEVNSGVEDFKTHILKPLIFMIQEKNKKHIKYMNAKFYISSSPISIFQTESFKQEIRLLWKHGQLSNKTYCEIVGETSYRTEIHRRDREAKEGIDEIMYPHLTDNKEGVNKDIPGEEIIPEDVEKTGKPKDRDKIDDKDKFKLSSKETDLEGAPYPTLQSLPDYIKKKYPKTQQNKWRKIWNNAYQYMLKKSGNPKRAESYAFRVANAQMKEKSKKKKK